MFANDVNNKISVSGYIVTSEKDKSGHIIQVSLQTDEFVNYTIENDKIGQELLQMVSKRIVVSGNVINQDYNGNNILSVTQYKVIH
ncbi:MAG: hypothetical protein KKB34_15550 [Bacteroidetes bacterium]|nr:hypothetical protein [Bacteroidota bacterium]